MVLFEQPLEKALSSCTIPSGLQKNIDHLSVLINGSPQVALLTLDLHEHFVDKKCISKIAITGFSLAVGDLPRNMVLSHMGTDIDIRGVYEEIGVPSGFDNRNLT